jgi:hypothetical protein
LQSFSPSCLHIFLFFLVGWLALLPCRSLEDAAEGVEMGDVTVVGVSTGCPSTQEVVVVTAEAEVISVEAEEIPVAVAAAIVAAIVVAVVFEVVVVADLQRSLSSGKLHLPRASARLFRWPAR